MQLVSGTPEEQEEDLSHLADRLEADPEDAEDEEEDEEELEEEES